MDMQGLLSKIKPLNPLAAVRLSSGEKSITALLWLLSAES